MGHLKSIVKKDLNLLSYQLKDIRVPNKLQRNGVGHYMSKMLNLKPVNTVYTYQILNHLSCQRTTWIQHATQIE